MTINILDKAKELLKIDPGDANNEWEIVTQLIVEAPAQSRILLEWLFETHAGYVDTRVKAGREILAIDSGNGWKTLEKLINSSDPDDRDTALTLLIETHDARSTVWAKELLHDRYPYLSLEAAEFLLQTYPDEVEDALSILVSNEQQWVREEAERLLLKLRTKPGSDNI